ncbi:MAG: hypothetical protein HKN78_12725 [Sphingomonadaceae bacterium]|nr:hypothetical protein [Sphingomonadaceae bacterium]
MGSCATTDYVPDTGWRDNDWTSVFYENWFGRQLRAMGEPPIVDDSDLAGHQSRFRLLILPSFRPASAYRVDQNIDGTGSLRAVVLDGAGGYEPGNIAQSVSRTLDPEELDQLESVISEASLDFLPREGEPEGVREIDGETVIRICMDGTTYVFEYLANGRRHYLERSCIIEENALRDLVDVTTALAPSLLDDRETAE